MEQTSAQAFLPMLPDLMDYPEQVSILAAHELTSHSQDLGQFRDLGTLPAQNPCLLVPPCHPTLTRHGEGW